MGRTITACVFDMDGVLIDTEPVWREVEHDVFARVGVELTDAQLRETWGMRIEEVVDYRYRVRPWNGIRPRAVEREIVREMVEHVRAHGVAMPGASRPSTPRETRIFASPSRHRRPRADRRSGRAAGYRRAIDAVCSADAEERGKPDPGVYISAAQALDVMPWCCVAIEDSPIGVSCGGRSGDALHRTAFAGRARG